MADFVNQAIMQQRRASGDPQGAAIAQNSAAAAASLQRLAQQNIMTQQAQQAQDQRDFQNDLTVLSLDWVPVDQKVQVANKRAQKMGLPGNITAEGLMPYRQLLTDMQKDVENGKDLSRWSSAVELFSANPSFVEPQQRPMVMQAQQQIQDQKAQQVAAQQFPSVEGGPEAQGRTQEARGRLALFESIQPNDPEAAQRLEAFTKVYGSEERLRQQIEADKLIVQAEDAQKAQRAQYASALKMAPAELAKLSAASLDPKTMLLQPIARVIQEKGLDGLDDADRRMVEAHYILNGQPEKLAILSEGGKVNELKRLQQDQDDARQALGVLDQVEKVRSTGKERIDTYQAAAEEALSAIEAHGSKMPTDSYEQRQATLGQLETATAVAVQDWDETVQPIRQELTNSRTNALNMVQELTRKMSRPGVDRVTLSKRRDFYQQMADSYETINASLGVQSEMDVALKRNELRALQIEAKTGSEEQRKSAQALLPKKQAELTMLEQNIDKQNTQVAMAKDRLSRMVKLSQVKLTATDKKLEQQQQNGEMANAYLADWAKGGFKTAPDGWYAENAKFFQGADAKLFMDIVKPAIDRRHDIQVGLAEQELIQVGDPKAAGKIAGKYGVKPSEILDALKNPNKPLVEVNTGAKASEEAAKDFTKSTRATYDQLKSAPILLRNIDEAKALIPKAKGFMGPGGESMLEAAKFLNARIGAKINTEGVKSAEELRTRIFFNIMENLKKMDAQPSEMQQMMMRDALGKLGTDPNALSGVLDAYGDTIRDKVELFNREVEGAEKKGTQFPYDPRVILPPRLSPTGEPMVKTDSEYNALPSGTVYIGPDGKKRTKK